MLKAGLTAGGIGFILVLIGAPLRIRGPLAR
jgi:hypothetical protein